MRIAPLAFVTVSSLVLAAGAAVAGGAYKAGLWEITTTMNMPGMPFQPPPFTFTQCMTEKDAVPKGDHDGSQRKCTVVDQRRDGNKVSWKVKCDGGTEGTGEVTYGDGTFDGTTRLTMKNPRTGQNMEMVQNLHGTYKGACK